MLAVAHTQGLALLASQMMHTDKHIGECGKTYFDPSGVRALPLAAGINVGGHYKWHFFLSLSLFLSFFPGSLLILPEGVVVGIQIFACGPELPIE